MTQVTATITIDGKASSMALEEKEYSTGKTGFWSQTKLVDTDGNRYQTQVQMVKIVNKN